VNTFGCPKERAQVAPRPRRAPPRGISLITSLMLLALISLVVVSGMRSGVLQAKMNSATQDRNLAFQAAEAALREAERATAATAAASFPGLGCDSGNCSRPAAADTPRWLDTAFTGWRNAAASAPAAAPQAQVIVEDMGSAPNWPGCENDPHSPPNCLTPRYRITARSAAEGRASVVLQTQMAAP
jgi:type IV pilus assembly protein PilX